MVYITLTLQQATQNIWHLLKRFNGKYGLECKFNETKREVYLPNESIIRLVGAADRGAGEKLRGGQYALCILDECKSFRPAILEELIDEVLTPALYDYIGPDGSTGGTLVVIGTPGNILAGPFYEATTGIDKTWTFHKWGVIDNVAMPHIWQAMLRDHEARGVSDDDPRWLREYKGNWVPSEELAVFNYRPGLDDDEPDVSPDWTHLLGVFLGVDGTFAATVLAYSDNYPTLFVVWDIREQNLSLTESARLVKQAAKRFNPAITIVHTNDFSKSLINRLNLHYELDLEVATGDDLSLVELVNTDFRDGIIKIYPNAYISEEMKILQWDDETKQRWNTDTPSACCLAFIHAWQEAQHRFYTDPRTEPTVREKQLTAETESLNRMAQRRGMNLYDRLAESEESYFPA